MHEASVLIAGLTVYLERVNTRHVRRRHFSRALKSHDILSLDLVYTE